MCVKPNIWLICPWMKPNLNKIENHIVSCSLPKQFCSFPNEMTKILLRDLSHASVNLKKKRELTHADIFTSVS